MLRVIAGLATAIATTIVAAQPAAADPAGVPPGIVNYNTVPVEDIAAVQAFETQAAQDVLTNHSLPASDFNAVRGWARNDVRAQMWQNLYALIKKNPSEHTSNEARVYHWFQTVMQKANTANALGAVQEYLKWSGLNENNFTTADPVNYNHADKSLATGGYCVYRAPEPYKDEYTGYNHQTCFTSDTVPINFIAPSPTWEQFLKYGAYRATMTRALDPDMGKAAFEVAATIAVGLAAATVGIALPMGMTLGLVTGTAVMVSSVMPHATWGAATGAVATGGALAGLVAIIVLFVVVTAIASYQLDAQLKMGPNLNAYLAKAQELADLHGYWISDNFRATDTSKPWTDEERKPRFYPTMFESFMLATLPEPQPEPCSGGLVVGGGVYNPGCINQPEPAAIGPNDRFFSVTPKDSTATSVQRSINAFDPVDRAYKTSRLSGKGWFVQREGLTSARSQSLGMNYIDWDGKYKRAQRFWDETNGYRFAVVNLADPSDTTFTDTLHVLQYDQTKVSVKMVAPPADQVAGISDVSFNLPEPAYNNADNVFAVTATGTASYTWWFPRIGADPLLVGEPPQGVPFNYIAISGASVTRRFDILLPTDVYLQINVAGETTMKKFRVNVVDGRATDVISYGDFHSLLVGQSQPLTLTTKSGLGVQQGSAPTSTCRLLGPINGIGAVTGVAALHAGTCTVHLATAGNADYLPAQQDLTFDIHQAEQTITLDPVHDMAAGETQLVTATTSSGLAPVVEVNGGTLYCSVSGNVVTAKKVGPCYLLVMQPGNEDYLPSRLISATINITKGAQQLIFATLPDREIGQQNLLTASSSSGLAVSLAVDESAAGICHISSTSDGRPVAIGDATGTCSIIASQAGNADFDAATSVTRTFQVKKITQSILFPTLIDTTVGFSQNIAPSAFSGLPVTVTVDASSASICSLNATMTSVTALAGGTCSLTATQAGNATYAAAAPVTRSFQISRAGQVITFDPLHDVRYGETQPYSAHASSGLSIVVSIGAGSPCAIVLLPAGIRATGTGTCTITVSQPGNGSYLAAEPVTQTFTISKALQTITVDPLSDLVFGSSQTVSAHTSSGLGVAVTVNADSTGVCQYDAPNIKAIGVGQCHLTVTQAGNGNYAAATPVQAAFEVVPATVWVKARDERIMYGLTPALEYEVSIAAANVTGVTCTTTEPITGAGQYTIECVGGTADPGYRIKHLTGTLQVDKAVATVTVAPGTAQYSDPVPNLNVVGSIQGLVGGDSLAGALSGCTASGLTVAAGKVTSQSGTYALAGCTGLSNPNYVVSYEGSLIVDRESATLTYGGGWNFSTGTGSTATVELTATVADAADGAPGDLTKGTVDFLLFKSTNFGTTPDYSRTGVAVSGSGMATASIASVPVDTYHVVTRLSAGNRYFVAVEEPAELIVWKPVPGTSATGGGQVADSADSNGRAHFGFSASIDKRSGPRGQLSFSWRNPVNGYDYIVRSNSWAGGAFIVKGTQANMIAKANLTVVNPATGAVVTNLSGGNYQIKVVAADNGSGGQTDTYSVVVTSPQGAAIHTVATTVVRGGNITVRA